MAWDQVTWGTVLPQLHQIIRKVGKVCYRLYLLKSGNVPYRFHRLKNFYWQDLGKEPVLPLPQTYGISYTQRWDCPPWPLVVKEWGWLMAWGCSLYLFLNFLTCLLNSALILFSLCFNSVFNYISFFMVLLFASVNHQETFGQWHEWCLNWINK